MEELYVEKFIEAFEDSAMSFSVHKTHSIQLEQAIEHALKLEGRQQAKKNIGVASKDRVRSAPMEENLLSMSR